MEWLNGGKKQNTTQLYSAYKRITFALKTHIVQRAKRKMYLKEMRGKYTYVRQNGL